MISVCIATYNGEKYIKQQLDSILSQLSDNDEVIVSDDSSTDGTLDIIHSLKDSRIQIFEGNSFHSPIYNFENALKFAKGDYIFLADQDDVWKPNKVEICMNYLKQYDLVISDAEIVDFNGNLISQSFFSVRGTKNGKYFNLIKNCYIGCCMAFTRKVLVKSLPFPKNLPMHDIWIGNVASFLCGKVFFSPEKLIEYRRHESNSSQTGTKSKRSLFTRLKERIFTVKCLIKRKNDSQNL